jgi:hypothetical protein
MLHILIYNLLKYVQIKEYEILNVFNRILLVKSL